MPDHCLAVPRQRSRGVGRPSRAAHRSISEQTIAGPWRTFLPARSTPVGVCGMATEEGRRSARSASSCRFLHVPSQPETGALVEIGVSGFSGTVPPPCLAFTLHQHRSLFVPKRLPSPPAPRPSARQTLATVLPASESCLCHRCRLWCHRRIMYRIQFAGLAPLAHEASSALRPMVVSGPCDLMDKGDNPATSAYR